MSVFHLRKHREYYWQFFSHTKKNPAPKIKENLIGPVLVSLEFQLEPIIRVRKIWLFLLSKPHILGGGFRHDIVYDSKQAQIFIEF